MEPVVVVSQPMFLPWHGLIEQMLLADYFVHYDDVAMPVGGSFMNRVQLKTATGVQWLTAPVECRTGQLIKDVKFAENVFWRKKHLKTLSFLYQRAPFGEDVVKLFQSIYEFNSPYLSDFNINALESIATYLGLNPKFLRSSDLPSEKRSTERLLDIVLRLHGKTYLTGHGAKNYLNFSLFEQNGVAVNFMNYDRIQWSQKGNDFTPYVSVLDLIADKGTDSIKNLKSQQIGWRTFCNG